MLKHFLAVLLAAGAFVTAPALAQQSAPSPAPSPSASPTPRPWQASGFATATYSAIGGASSFSFINGTPARVFDAVGPSFGANAPLLNAVNVQLQKNGAIGGKLEVEAGANADVISSYPYNFNPSQHYPGIDVPQAYLSGTSGQFSLQVGKFETLAGAEVIEDPSDVNVSRSILFGYAVPFTHTGARLTWSPTSTVSAIVGINNGWDNLKGPGTGARTAEFGLAYTGKVLGLTAQTYQGTERLSDSAWSTPLGSPAGHRSLVDLVGTYHVTPDVTLQANYDTGRQQNAALVDGTGALVDPSGTATWNGLAEYASWQITPRWATAIRAENFIDGGGYRTGFTQRWAEQTLTFGFAASATLTLRAEVRVDTSSQPLFTRGAGGAAALQSYELQALVKY